MRYIRNLKTSFTIFVMLMAILACSLPGRDTVLVITATPSPAAFAPTLTQSSPEISQASVSTATPATTATSLPTFTSVATATTAANIVMVQANAALRNGCLLYTSPSPRDS